MAGNSDRPPAPPAGWFADPAGSPYLRWWDGSGWTDNFIDARTGAPPAELASAPAPRGAIAAAAAEPGDTGSDDAPHETDSAPVAVSESGALSAVSSGSAEQTDEEPRPAIALPAVAVAPAVVADVAEPAPIAAVADAVPSTASADAPPLTRREARARERRAEEARTGALTIPAQSDATEVESEQPEAAQPEQHEPIDADELLARPVSAARSVDSLGEVSEPDAVAPPEEGVSAEAVPSVGSLGIPGPETLAVPAADESPANSPAESSPANAAQDAPVIPQPGTTVSAPSLADFVSGPPLSSAATSTAPAESSPSAVPSSATPSSEALFDFAGITPTGAVPTVTPAIAPPTNAWAAAPAPSSAGAFPLGVGDGSSYTPMETRRPAMASGALPEPSVSTWAVWVFAALPLLHGALAWLVFDLLKPTDTSIVRWVVLFGPIVLYLVLAGVDRWTLRRAGHLSVAPVPYAIVPPLYLAIRVVRMGVRALAPLLVWVLLTAAVVAALVFALPDVLTGLTG